MKLFWLSLIIPVLFCAQYNVVSFFEGYSTIQIYRDGTQIELSEENKNKFDELFCSSIEGAIQKPAYGVITNDILQEQLKQGIWIKFTFSQTIIKSQMPFDELIINITKDSSGLNIYRGNDGVFEGRCFYLDLKGNLNDLYDFIENLSPSNTTSEVELENQEPEKTSLVDDKNDNEDEDDKTDDAPPDDKKPSLKLVSKLDENYDDQPQDKLEDKLPESQKELLNHLQ